MHGRQFTCCVEPAGWATPGTPPCNAVFSIAVLAWVVWLSSRLVLTYILAVLATVDTFRRVFIHLTMRAFYCGF